MKTSWHIWIVVALLLLVNFFAIKLVVSHQENQLVDIRMRLLEIENYSNAENELLLLSNNSKVIAYDEVVSQHNNIISICNDLNNSIGQLKNGQQFIPLIEDLIADIAKKNRLIQQFKSRNSVLLNSMNSLQLLKNNLPNSAKHYDEIRSLKEHVLLYKTYGNQEMLKQVHNDLNLFPQTSLKQDNELKMLVIHTSNILASEKTSSNLLQEILNSSVASKAKLVRKEITKISTTYVASVKNYLLSFISLNILLFVALGVINRRLQNKSLSLLELNNSLEDTVNNRTKRLARRNDDLEQFGYIATHDLKVPVDNIKGYMDILKEFIDDKHAEEAGEIISWIDKSINQAEKTLSDLSKVAQLGAIQDNYKTLEFKSIFDRVVDSLQFSIEKHKVVIHENFDACTNINFSDLQLTSIFQNILSNAIKYQSPDRSPVISITSKIEGEMVRIDFEDNGLGIDLKTQYDKLFGLFKRIYVTEEGSGLGLYMIKKIIEDADGKIEVTSEVGVGTTFSVYLRKTIMNSI